CNARVPFPSADRPAINWEDKMETTTASNLVTLHYDDRGDGNRVAWVTFNNPEKRNALGLGGKDRFVEIMTSLRHDMSVRAIVITGAGDKSFVGGTNLAELAMRELK
ncbi:MAG TPA: enoyl-CoA hydratase-related protein, partial [Reyranella sp.]|nr:enoyl-CoA hydratase-related protein [Reyranella sp.]